MQFLYLLIARFGSMMRRSIRGRGVMQGDERDENSSNNDNDENVQDHNDHVEGDVRDNESDNESSLGYP